MTAHARARIAFVISAVAFAGGCTSNPPPPPDPNTHSAMQAAHVDITFYANGKVKGSCSGVLVGPRAVLTAAHCVSNKSTAVVRAPNAGNRWAKSHVAWWFDWSDESAPDKSPGKHDIAILELDAPITLVKYPQIATTAPKEGDRASLVHRMSTTAKAKNVSFLSERAVVHSASAQGFPKAYRLDVKTTSRDIGGPVYSSSGKIIGVVGGKGTTGQVFYAPKTKTLLKWIHTQLLALLHAPAAPLPPSAPPPSAPSPAKDAGTGSAPKSGGSGSGDCACTPGKMGQKSSGGKTSSSTAKDKTDQTKDQQQDQDKEKETLPDECDPGDDSCNDECFDDGCDEEDTDKTDDEEDDSDGIDDGPDDDGEDDGADDDDGYDDGYGDGADGIGDDGDDAYDDAGDDYGDYGDEGDDYGGEE